jgi:hypothetical protein
MPTRSAPSASDGPVKQTVLLSGSSSGSDNGLSGLDRSRPVRLLLRCRRNCWWCW